MVKPDRTVCIAPMMTHTDRHFRYFLRLISKHVMLYTEMVTTGALIHGNAKKYLHYNQEEHPLALQLGGNDPQALAQCTRLAADTGYDEVNLNIGCPSDRVQSGQFGACLMAEPQLVADCIHAMQSAVGIPVTVKCRIGIDDQDSYEALADFISLLSGNGCNTFIIHARIAILEGLSPRQNREVPPLKYETVRKIKRDFPDLEIIINGGINTVEQIHKHLETVDGVMLGRAVCNNPFMLNEIEKEIFNYKTSLTRNEVIQAYSEYVGNELSKGTPLSHMTRNILGIFHGQPGAREFRRYMSENIYRPGSGIEVLKQAVEVM